MPHNSNKPAADQVLIAANPRAGAYRQEEPLCILAERLRSAGMSVTISSNLDEVTAAAIECHAAGRLKALIAAGGDGTVAEIVNRTPPGLPITVFPQGTANLLAHHLGITADPLAVCRTVLFGSRFNIDAGRANGRVFLLMVGCGFDADVVERLHRGRSGHIRYWSYAKPILAAIRNYEYPEFRITCQSASGVTEHTMVVARWAFAVNLPCYAGGLRLAPRATATDGLLDVCTFARGSLWHGLRYLSHVVLGRHGSLDDCRTHLTPRLRIESDRSVPYQLDGDPGGFLPLEIEVLRGRMTLLAPAACAAQLGSDLAAETVPPAERVPSVSPAPAYSAGTAVT